jgi:hypothetical protein
LIQEIALGLSEGISDGTSTLANTRWEYFGGDGFPWSRFFPESTSRYWSRLRTAFTTLQDAANARLARFFTPQE